MYCKASLMRAGLGNRLFPWARCRLFAHTHRATMLTPFWFDPKLGPLLRGETDLRLYHGLFQARPDDVGPWKSRWIERSLRPRPEPERLSAPLPDEAQDALFVFEGLRDYFTPLLGSERFLGDELRAMTRARWVREADNLPPPPIMINVRCGDFHVAKTPEEMFTRGGMRTPPAWFVKTLAQVREAMGFPAKAFLISDGHEHELKEILDAPDVTWIKPSNAIVGILAMARAGVFLGSGGSSFSAWASFLGGMPTVTHPGQDLRWFGMKDTAEQFIGVFDPARPEMRFLDQVARVGRAWREKRAA